MVFTGNEIQEKNVHRWNSYVRWNIRLLFVKYIDTFGCKESKGNTCSTQKTFNMELLN